MHRNVKRALNNKSNLVPRVFVTLNQLSENERLGREQPFQACAIDADCLKPDVPVAGQSERDRNKSVLSEHFVEERWIRQNMVTPSVDNRFSKICKDFHILD